MCIGKYTKIWPGHKICLGEFSERTESRWVAKSPKPFSLLAPSLHEELLGNITDTGMSLKFKFLAEYFFRREKETDTILPVQSPRSPGESLKLQSCKVMKGTLKGNPKQPDLMGTNLARPCQCQQKKPHGIRDYFLSQALCEFWRLSIFFQYVQNLMFCDFKGVR